MKYFEPFSSFIVDDLTEGARPSSDDGFAEFVTVVAGSVAGADDDVQRTRQSARIFPLALPRQIIAGNQKIAETVTHNGCHYVTTPTHCL